MRVAHAPTKPTGVSRAARAVYVTFAAQTLSLAALVIFEEVRGRQLATELAAFGGRPSGADAEALAGPATAFAVLLLLAVAATVAAAAAYTTWLLRIRQACSLPAARSAVAAAWLIPGVNLLAPAVLLSETWRLATPQESRRTRLALVTAWWLSWLTTLAVFTLVLPHDASDGLTGLGLLELACLTLSAALCAATVHRITVLQPTPALHTQSPTPKVTPTTSLGRAT